MLGTGVKPECWQILNVEIIKLTISHLLYLFIARLDSV